jgi:hypothetical protein
LKATINYNCTLGTETSVQLVDLSVAVEYYIKVTLAYESIHFTIQSVTGTPTFRPVGSYVVTNVLLAQFKVNEILKSFNGHRVLGDGFPSWPRDFPNAEVRKGYAFFYDSSHIPHQENLQTI